MSIKEEKSTQSEKHKPVIDKNANYLVGLALGAPKYHFYFVYIFHFGDAEKRNKKVIDNQIFKQPQIKLTGGSRGTFSEHGEHLLLSFRRLLAVLFGLF